MQRRSLLALAAGAALPAARGSTALPPPLSVQGLRALAAEPRTLQRAGDIDGGPGFSAHLVAYQHSGLLLHAMVAVPLTPPPAAGHPVLVANHGFHPDPPRYGFTPEGHSARPGNYYRPVPSAYASAGFVVVLPDYRGHNTSQGGDFTRSALASTYYAEDVVALIGGLNGGPNAVPNGKPTGDAMGKPVWPAAVDTRNLFLWGHSMGGPVTLRVLLACTSVRGASLWATAQWDAEPDLAALQTPLMLQHAAGDPSTRHDNSVRLAAELGRLRKPCVFHTVQGDRHFFQDAEFDAAVARDVAFFRGLMLLALASPR